MRQTGRVKPLVNQVSHRHSAEHFRRRQLNANFLCMTRAMLGVSMSFRRLHTYPQGKWVQLQSRRAYWVAYFQGFQAHLHVPNVPLEKFNAVVSATSIGFSEYICTVQVHWPKAKAVVYQLCDGSLPRAVLARYKVSTAQNQSHVRSYHVVMLWDNVNRQVQLYGTQPKTLLSEKQVHSCNTSQTMLSQHSSKHCHRCSTSTA